MTHGRFAKTISVLLVAMAAVCTLIYLGLKPTFGYPDEAERIRHEAGFSIIMPSKWQKLVSYRNREGTIEDGFMLSDEKSEGAPSSIAVAKLHRPPEIESLMREGATESTFQGHPAWRVEKKRKLEQGISIYVEIQSHWYRFVLGKPHKIREEELQAFLNTFRVETLADPASSAIIGTK